jgi:hypothetical protein
MFIRDRSEPARRGTCVSRNKQARDTFSLCCGGSRPRATAAARSSGDRVRTLDPLLQNGRHRRVRRTAGAQANAAREATGGRAAPRRETGCVRKLRNDRACGAAQTGRKSVRRCAGQRRRRSPRFAGTTPQSTEPPHAIMATMRYTTQNVPYGPLAAALARGVAVTAAPDAALPRDAQPTLALASGCAPAAKHRARTLPLCSAGAGRRCAARDTWRSGANPVQRSGSDCAARAVAAGRRSWAPRRRCGIWRARARALTCSPAMRGAAAAAALRRLLRAASSRAPPPARRSAVEHWIDYSAKVRCAAAV